MARHTVGSTSIIGTHVENWDGENLGVIEEVMIDKNYGEVSYLVLAYPGRFGPRYHNKRFAIPFNAIAMKQITPREVEYILNVDEAFLKRAPGFDKHNWPDFADKTFKSTLADFYKDVSVDVFA